MSEQEHGPVQARRRRFRTPKDAVQESGPRPATISKRVLGGVALVAAGAGGAIAVSQIDDALSATALCCKGGTPLHGDLFGREEIGEDGRRGAGDPDARGSATAIIRGDLCFGLTVKDLDAPTAAHIHRGRAGRNGPIVVTLVPPSGGFAGASSGCVTITRRLANAIRENPERYYWNIRTERFPEGAVRGQIVQLPGPE